MAYLIHVPNQLSTPMKILYAIQGTGNGHLARAMDVIPCLKRHGEVDLLISGTQADIELPYKIKYRFRGLGFIFGKSGGVDVWKTIGNANLPVLLKEIRNLPVSSYDLVISDFEPVSSWACKLKNKACIGLSHQIGVVHRTAPKASHRDLIGAAILRYYAPTRYPYGFHFQAYASNIFTPVIRNQIRIQQVTDKGHYAVYLPAFNDEILVRFLSRFPDIHWEVFSKHNHEPAVTGNIKIFPVDNEKFIESMASSRGVLCGAGFETPAEALYLKKKVLAIPMTNQYEQHLNAAALQKMGVPIIYNLHSKNDSLIRDWLDKPYELQVDYEDQIQKIVDRIIATHGSLRAVTS